MPDGIPASLTLGGKITPGVLTLLYQVASESDVGIGWEPSVGTQAEFEQAVAGLKGEPLLLTDENAPEGEFEALERFCREHQLTYVRHTAAKYEYDARFVWWAPGMPKPASGLATNGEDSAVIVADVRAALAEGKKAIKAVLDQATPVTVPALKITTLRKRARGVAPWPLHQPGDPSPITQTNA